MAVDLTFHTDLKNKEKQLRAITEQKIRKLAKRYEAITDATVNVVQESPANTPYLVKASIILHTKPKQIVATKKGENPAMVLRDAFDAVERQTRKFFDKLQEPWEEPGEKVSASGEET